MQSAQEKLLSLTPECLHEQVLLYWQDWSAALERDGSLIVDESIVSLAVLGKTWACSDYVAQNCIRYPATFYTLVEEGFDSTRSISDYQQLVETAVKSAGDDDTALMKVLRELRQQEMLRIAWRDINELTSVQTILHELSDFSEAVVSVVLRHLEQQFAEKHGMPCDENGEEQFLLVFAMGKMGGRELNFSSDIDLIFCFAEDGETTGRRKISHYEFYLAVIRKLVKILDEMTADGFVYRVDTRLRPFGESGPMAMSFSGMEQYYQLQGRDWERYAMIKAKVITGAEQNRQYLRSMLTPFVYRRYLDFSMLESIREMKAMINRQMQRKRMTNNIKLGRGGIREIEFIGQTLQLIRAGREPELRERSIVKVLRLLAEKNHLQKDEVQQLIDAYWYLRKLENRLQMMRDKQTHVLPDDELSQQRLCLSMQLDHWQELLSQLSLHQDNVDRVFQNLISHDEEDSEGLRAPFTLMWSDADTHEDLRQYLLFCGFNDADAAQGLLVDLQQCPQLKALTGDSRRRIEKLLISLIRQIAVFEQQLVLLERVIRLIKALAGRKVYISLLLEYPQVQQKMLKLCAASEWFTERLIKYPILLDGLLVSIELIRQQYDFGHLLALEMARIESQDETVDADLEQQMERMRQFKRQNVFNIAVFDVFYDEPVEAVSDQLTELANVLLANILDLSWQTMLAKYGEPTCLIDGKEYKPTMSIIAYGKMGGNELGYSSDLDIIFLHNSAGKKQMTSGEKTVENQRFFARVAQRVVHFLDTRTYSGVLYESDTRLRPNGQSGLMVSSIAAFESYQHEKAWTWEHQALIRARFVTGNALIEQEFDRIRSSVLRQRRDTAKLLQEVVEMREKMRNHLSHKRANFDIKQDAGGLVDIEFMTQAGVLIHAEHCADCIKHTATLELINELEKIGWYEAGEAKNIGDAYRYFRKLKNWQNLECEADISDIPLHRDNVVAVWNRLMPDVHP